MSGLTREPQVVLIQNNGGGFETDNHTVGTVAAAIAVPEPATWAMMIVGLGAMGALARRRQVFATA